MAVTGIAVITFACDCCGALENRHEAEGYETSSAEKPPDGWRYFRAAFTAVASATDTFLLCANCVSRVRASLSDLTTASGKMIL